MLAIFHAKLIEEESSKKAPQKKSQEIQRTFIYKTEIRFPWMVSMHTRYCRSEENSKFHATLSLKFSCVSIMAAYLQVYVHKNKLNICSVLNHALKYRDVWMPTNKNMSTQLKQIQACHDASRITDNFKRGRFQHGQALNSVAVLIVVQIEQSVPCRHPIMHSITCS